MLTYSPYVASENARRVSVAIEVAGQLGFYRPPVETSPWPAALVFLGIAGVGLIIVAIRKPK